MTDAETTAHPDAPAPEIAIRVLGPVSVAGTAVRGRLATLLALLACAKGRTVTSDRILLELWPDEPPHSASASLHVYVSRLRRLLEPLPAQVVTRHPGYGFDAPPGLVDLDVFATHAREAEQASEQADWPRALQQATAAGQTWDGTPFGGALLGQDLVAAAAKLESRRLAAQEIEALALIELGRPAEAEKLTESLLSEDSLNERRWHLRMRAQYAAGNTALALATFQQFRTLLSEELGVDPSPALRQLHQKLLTADAPAPVEVEPDSPIGRLAERTAIEFALRSATASAGRVILLRGEPGIGKSRLADFATTIAARRGVRAVHSRGMDGAGTPALWMWEEVLGALGDRRYGVEVLQSIVARLPTSVAESDERGFRLAQAITSTVVAYAERAPLLIVLDDVQWADEGTLQTVYALANAIARRPIALVVAARTVVDPEAPVNRRLAAVSRLPHCDSFELRGFERHEVAQMLPEGAPLISIQQLLEWTGGNPYFLAQMIRSGPQSSIPATALELLRARIRALPQATIDTLELLAVTGRQAPTALIATAAGNDPVDQLRLAEPAIIASLVGITGDDLTFTHDLAREAVLASISGHRRIVAHGRIADAMAIRDPERLNDPEQYADQRFSAAGGGPSQEAFEACRTAADHAASMLAYARAAVHRTRALAMLEPTVHNRRDRFSTLHALAQERRLSGDVVGASEAVQRAVELAQIMGDRTLLRHAVDLYGGVTLWNWRQFEEVDSATIEVIEELLPELPPDDPALVAARAQLLGTLAVERYYGQNRPQGVEEADEAARLSRTIADPILRSRVLNNLVIANWYPGRDDIRLAALNESLGFEGAGLPLVAEAVARMHRASLRLRYADIVGYEEDLERSFWLVPRLLRDELDGQFGAQRAGHAILRGEFLLARELIDEAYARFGRTTLWGADWTKLVMRTSIARLTGTLDDVVDELVAAAAQDVNRTLRWTAVLALAELGRLTEARDCQSRWGLRHLPSRTHWGTQFEWAQAGEISLLLGAPRPQDVYAALLPSAGQLIDVGTALAVWGTVDDLLARLADRIGDSDAADEHRVAARALTARVRDQLGAPPSWTAHSRT